MTERILELGGMPETVKGKVVEVGKPEETETQFGKQWRVPVRVKVGKQEVVVNLWITQKAIERGAFHPRSQIAKLLAITKAKNLKDLEGKEVELRVDQRGFYRFLV